MEFFISGIIPGDWGFFQIWGYLSPGIGDFLGMSFFRGMGYLTKKPPLAITVENSRV